MPQAHVLGVGSWSSMSLLEELGFSIHQKTLTIALSMLAHYNWLSHWAETTGAMRWNTLMKRHYTRHLA